jgi:cytoskeletal protein RodZ
VAGVPDDPSEQPTRMAEYGADGSLQQVLGDEPERADEAADSAEPDFAPDPWYRNRVLLALWALAVALVLTLIIYGLVELSRGGEGGAPATTTPSTSHTRSSTTSSTTTTTTTPSSSSETPPPETPEQTSEQAPPQNTYSPAPSEPPRHHHHFHLPHLPNGFF